LKKSCSVRPEMPKCRLRFFLTTTSHKQSTFITCIHTCMHTWLEFSHSRDCSSCVSVVEALGLGGIIFTSLVVLFPHFPLVPREHAKPVRRRPGNPLHHALRTKKRASHVKTPWRSLPTTRRTTSRTRTTGTVRTRALPVDPGASKSVFRHRENETRESRRALPPQDRVSVNSSVSFRLGLAAPGSVTTL